MIRVLVCWEDRFHEALDLCLRRTLQHRRAAGLALPEERRLFFDDARGYGGFERYVREDWPRSSCKGLPRSGGPIHHLICVADADRASDCCGEDAPPTLPAATRDWIERCNASWTRRLRGATSVEPLHVHGRFLRWNKESLIIAGHDSAAAMRRLGCRDLTALHRHLTACAPNPLLAMDEQFTDLFRRPGRCLAELVTAAGGRQPRKSDPTVDDALKEISGSMIARLCTRIPDLIGLAELVESVSA